MTARSWSQCWRAFASHDPAGVGDPGPVRIGSLPTRVTAIRGVVVCFERARSPIRFPNGAISGRVAPHDVVGRWHLSKQSMRGAMSSSAVSTGSSSGRAWPPAMKSEPPTIGRWWSSRPLSSGLSRDSSDRPISQGEQSNRQVATSSVSTGHGGLVVSRACACAYTKRVTMKANSTPTKVSSTVPAELSLLCAAGRMSLAPM